MHLCLISLFEGDLTEMDFHAMKRRRLQQLCKKHGIRANLKNITMAEKLTLLFKEKQEDEKSMTQVDVEPVEAYRSSADEVESDQVTARILCLQHGSMLESVSGEKVDKGLHTGIYDSEEENHLVHSKDVTEEMLEIHNIGILATCSADSNEPSMLKPEIGVDFSTDSPITASDFENKALEVEAASPILKILGLKGLFRDEQTSGLKKSGLEMSKGTSNCECIDGVKNVEEFEVAVQELYHQEHKVMGQVLELKSTSDTGGVLEKIHPFVQEGNDSTYLKPGKVSSLKFKGLSAGIDYTPVSGLRHDETEIRACEIVGSPVVNNLGMNWLSEYDEVKKSDPELSNAVSGGDAQKGNGGEVGAGELCEHKHQSIQEDIDVKSTQELSFHCRMCSPVTDFSSHENKAAEGCKAASPLKAKNFPHWFSSYEC